MFHYAGSKRRLLPFFDEILDLYAPHGFENFYELFGGSGAFVEHLAANRKSVASKLHYNEYSPDIHRAFLHTRDHPEAVTERLGEMLLHWNFIGNGTNKNPERNAFYFEVRKRYREMTPEELSNPRNTGDLLFLILYMFHGILKVCKHGKIRTSPSDLTRNANIKDQISAIWRMSALLQNVEITNLSYEQVDIQPGSFVYCDPPYFDSEIKYGAKKIYTESPTVQFIKWCADLAREKECLVWMSNYEKDGGFVFDAETTFGADVFKQEVRYNINPSKIFHAHEIVAVWDGRPGATPKKLLPPSTLF